LFPEKSTANINRQNGPANMGDVNHEKAVLSTAWKLASFPLADNHLNQK
jgi:hypothetical protein